MLMLFVVSPVSALCVVSQNLLYWLSIVERLMSGPAWQPHLLGFQIEVVVRALCGDAHAIQAVHGHGGRLGQRALQGIEVVLVRAAFACCAAADMAQHASIQALLNCRHATAREPAQASLTGCRRGYADACLAISINRPVLDALVYPCIQLSLILIDGNACQHRQQPSTYRKCSVTGVGTCACQRAQHPT